MKYPVERGTSFDFIRVPLNGKEAVVRSIPYIWGIEYNRRRRVDVDLGWAFIAQKCVLEPDFTPTFTADQASAFVLADDPQVEVLIDALIQMMTISSEKKAKRLTDSNTASPLPLAEPSASSTPS